MNPETWQIIAAVVVALLVLGAVVWLIFARRDSSSTRGKEVTISRDEFDRLKSDHAALQDTIESIREKQGLLSERSERYDRTISEMRQGLSQLEEGREARKERFNTMEKTHQELQEQIYELRSEQKVLMQREDRLERRIGELSDAPLGDGTAEERRAAERSKSDATTSDDNDRATKL